MLRFACCLNRFFTMKRFLLAEFKIINLNLVLRGYIAHTFNLNFFPNQLCASSLNLFKFFQYSFWIMNTKNKLNYIAEYTVVGHTAISNWYPHRERLIYESFKKGVMFNWLSTVTLYGFLRVIASSVTVLHLTFIDLRAWPRIWPH